MKYREERMEQPRKGHLLLPSLSTLCQLGKCQGNLGLVRISDEILHSKVFRSNQPYKCVFKPHLGSTCSALNKMISVIYMSRAMKPRLE